MACNVNAAAHFCSPKVQLHDLAPGPENAYDVFMKSAPEPFAYIALLDCTVFEDSALFDSVLSRMDEARRAKVLALRSEKDRGTSLGAGYLAAFLLERYAENYVNRPAWMIRYGTDGRPVITDTDGTPAPLYLSLSHSGDHAMAGLSSSPVGVDLELLAQYLSIYYPAMS